MSTWLDEHLETFVRPVLHTVPNVGLDCPFFTPIQIKCLHAIWKRIKFLAQDRTILLAGRDVWLFEVIARMQNDHPTEFRKEISSDVARSKLLKDDFSQYHCLDTGYQGTIPKELGCVHWHLISWNNQPYDKTTGAHKVETYKEMCERRAEHMVFPGLQIRRYVPKTAVLIHRGSPIIEFAGTLEGSSKYWERGSIHYNEKGEQECIAPQPLSPTSTFKNAACLTRQVAESCQYPAHRTIFSLGTR